MGKKTLRTARRLARGKLWISTYTGQHILKAYRKRFAVDHMTAINDLHSIGAIDDIRYEQLKQNELARVAALRAKREGKALEAWQKAHEDQDDRFFFIAGYTSGGAPYGVTWEEMGLKPWSDPENMT